MSAKEREENYNCMIKGIKICELRSMATDILMNTATIDRNMDLLNKIILDLRKEILEGRCVPSDITEAINERVSGALKEIKAENYDDALNNIMAIQYIIIREPPAAGRFKLEIE